MTKQNQSVCVLVTTNINPEEVINMVWSMCVERYNIKSWCVDADIDALRVTVPIDRVFEITEPYTLVVNEIPRYPFNLKDMLGLFTSEELVGYVSFEPSTNPLSFMITGQQNTPWCVDMKHATTGYLTKTHLARAPITTDYIFASLPSVAHRIKCVLINLDRRPDRMDKMNKQAHLLPPFSRMSAVDGKALLPSARLNALCSVGDYNMRPGVIGCALSHLKLYKQLLEDDGADAYVIFEDDVKVDETFRQRLVMVIAHCIAVGSDISFLTSVPLKTIKDPESIPYSKTGIVKREAHIWSEVAGGTGCYYITKSSAASVLDYVDERGITSAIDMILMYKVNLGQRFCLPPILTQYGVDSASDIQGDHNTVSHLKSDIQCSPYRIYGEDGDIDFLDDVLSASSSV
jgi:GR25 family glycosyltransferase involved in LPS biosynthesis